MNGPPPDCHTYERDCACWRCIRHFHLQVAAFEIDMIRKYGLLPPRDGEPAEDEAA